MNDFYVFVLVVGPLLPLLLGQNQTLTAAIFEIVDWVFPPKVRLSH